MSSIRLSILNMIKFKIPGKLTSQSSDLKNFSNSLLPKAAYLTYISPTTPTLTFGVRSILIVAKSLAILSKFALT